MWNSLSMKDKAAYMKVAIKNGITDLNDIIGRVNLYVGGGDTNRKKPENNAGQDEDEGEYGIRPVNYHDPNEEIYWNEEDRTASERLKSDFESALFSGNVPAPLPIDENSQLYNLSRIPTQEQRLRAIQDPRYQQYTQYVTQFLKNSEISNTYSDSYYDFTGFFINDPDNALKIMKLAAEKGNPLFLPNEFAGYSNPLFSDYSYYSGVQDVIYNPQQYRGGLFNYDVEGNLEGFILSPDQQLLLETLTPEQLYEKYFPLLGSGAGLYKIPSPLWNTIFQQPLYNSNIYDTRGLKDTFNNYRINITEDVADAISSYIALQNIPPVSDYTLRPIPLPNPNLRGTERDPAPASVIIEPYHSPTPRVLSPDDVEQAFNNSEITTTNRQNSTNGSNNTTNRPLMVYPVPETAQPVINDSIPVERSSEGLNNFPLIDLNNFGSKRVITTPTIDRILGRKKAEGGVLNPKNIFATGGESTMGRSC